MLTEVMQGPPPPRPHGRPRILPSCCTTRRRGTPTPPRLPRRPRESQPTPRGHRRPLSRVAFDFGRDRRRGRFGGLDSLHRDPGRQRSGDLPAAALAGTEARRRTRLQRLGGSGKASPIRHFSEGRTTRSCRRGLRDRATMNAGTPADRLQRMVRPRPTTAPRAAGPADRSKHPTGPRRTSTCRSATRCSPPADSRPYLLLATNLVVPAQIGRPPPHLDLAEHFEMPLHFFGMGENPAEELASLHDHPGGEVVPMILRAAAGEEGLASHPTNTGSRGSSPRRHSSRQRAAPSLGSPPGQAAEANAGSGRTTPADPRTTPTQECRQSWQSPSGRTTDSISPRDIT